MKRWITARRIHDGKRFLPAGTVMGIDERDIITDIGVIDAASFPDIDYYDGVIMPMHVNAHCHLELSHLHGKIPRHTGLIGFVKQVIQLRNDTDVNTIQRSILRARDQAYAHGIIAMGDICNTPHTIPMKAQEVDMYFHSFIESLGVLDTKATVAYQQSQALYQSFISQHLHRASIVPHAPYSVSSSLMGMIMQHSDIKSIHMEESVVEKEWMMAGVGDMSAFYQWLGLDTAVITSPMTRSIDWYQQHRQPPHTSIFVHGTYLDDTDLQAITTDNYAYICLCPKANLYIEGKLPPIDQMMRYDIPICIGTDSLASNEAIDIWSELQVIRHHFPDISWETLIRWATYHGATALGMNDVVGSISIGRKAHLYYTQDINDDILD